MVPLIAGSIQLSSTVNSTTIFEIVRKYEEKEILENSWLTVPMDEEILFEGGKRLSKLAPSISADVPKVSIITVVYNNVQTVAKCIESVLSQTYKNIEYIIVDGASNDGTLDVIKQYQIYQNIQLSHQCPTPANNLSEQKVIHNIMA